MPQFYIMKAYHLTNSGRKLNLKKIFRDEPNSTVLMATRKVGYNKYVPVFIIGCPGTYGVKPGDQTTYTIDTGNGYRCRNQELEIEHIMQVKNGELVEVDGQEIPKGLDGKGVIPQIDARYTFVMK